MLNMLIKLFGWIPGVGTSLKIAYISKKAYLAIRKVKIDPDKANSQGTVTEEYIYSISQTVLEEVIIPEIDKLKLPLFIKEKVKTEALALMTKELEQRNIGKVIKQQYNNLQKQPMKNTDKIYFDIVNEIYAKYDPVNTANIPQLIAEYNGTNQELIKSLFVKFSADPVDFDFFKKYIDLNFKEFLLVIYSKYNPAKVAEIPSFVEKFKDKKEAFIKQLSSRYKIDSGTLLDLADFRKIETGNPSLQEKIIEKKLIIPEVEKTVLKKIIAEIPQSVIEMTSPPEKKKNKTTWIVVIILLLIAGSIFTFYFVSNLNVKQQKALEEKRIADSIRIADSLAMVLAEQQRIADSIMKAQQSNESQSTDDTIVSTIKTIIENYYRYSQEKSYAELIGMFTNPVEQYFSLTNLTPDEIIKDREQYGKKFSLENSNINFDSLAIFRDPDATSFDVSFNTKITVLNLRSNQRTIFFESIYMKLNSEFKIYHVTENIISKNIIEN